MDPVTVLSAATIGCRTVGSVGVQLYAFVKDARNVNENVRSLAAEATQLGSICNAVRDVLRSLLDQYGPQLAVRTPAEGSGLSGLGDGIVSVLDECEKAMAKLQDAIPRSKETTGFFGKNLKLNMSSHAIETSRSHIRAFTNNLQLCLHILTLQVNNLMPTIANPEMLQRMNTIEGTLSQNSVDLNIQIMQSARAILSQSESLYQASITGSVIDVENQAKADRTVLNWMNRLEIGSSSSSSQAGKITSSSYDTNEPYARHRTQVNRDDVAKVEAIDTGHALAGSLKAPDADSNASEDEYALEITNDVLSSGLEAFSAKDWSTAEVDFQEALKLRSRLPQDLRDKCDVSEIQYKLAVCAFHEHDFEAAETALLGVLDATESSDIQLSNIYHAGHMLAQVYTRQGKLHSAAKMCEFAQRGYLKIAGKDNIATFESSALLSRILELQGNQSLARIYAKKIPGDCRENLCETYRSLSPSVTTSETIENSSIPALIAKPVSNTKPPEVSTTDNSTTGSCGCASFLVRFASSDSSGQSVTSSSSRHRMNWKSSEIIGQHIGSVTSVAISPAGDRLASTSCTKQASKFSTAGLKLWSLPDGELVKALIPWIAVKNAIFSPDSTLLVASTDGVFQVFDRNGIRLSIIRCDGLAFCHTFQPGWGLLAVSSYSRDSISLWDAAKGMKIKTVLQYQGDRRHYQFMAYSPDGGSLVVVESTGYIRVWDTVRERWIAQLQVTVQNSTIRNLTFSSDGQILASSSGTDMIDIWDTSTWKLVKTMWIDTSVHGLNFFPGHKVLVVTSKDDQIGCWDIESETKIANIIGSRKECEANQQRLNALAFTPDGTVAVLGSADKDIKVYKVALTVT